MRTTDLRMNANQKNLANSLKFQLKGTREAIANLMVRMENFEGAHADIAYRLLKLAHDATGNIDELDLVEIARLNASPARRL